LRLHKQCAACRGGVAAAHECGVARQGGGNLLDAAVSNRVSNSSNRFKQLKQFQAAQTPVVVDAAALQVELLLHAARPAH
jgi:hypothetical protein